MRVTHCFVDLLALLIRQRTEGIRRSNLRSGFSLHSIPLLPVALETRVFSRRRDAECVGCIALCDFAMKCTTIGSGGEGGVGL